MSVWIIRGGRDGEHESIDFEHGVVAIGWAEVPDLSQFRDKDELAAELRLRRSQPKATTTKTAGELWAFSREIHVGDLVVMPLRSSKVVALGKVTGEYEYRSDLPGAVHARAARWLNPEIPREQLGEDINRSLSLRGPTVRELEAVRSESRMLALA